MTKPEEDRNSPGTMSGENDVVRHPTAMPSGGHQKPQKNTPTVIGMGNGAQASKPTIITVSRRTSIGPTKMAPTAPMKLESVHSSLVTKPSAIPGTIRKRIPVTSEELRREQANTQPVVLERVLQLVQEFSPDTANDRVAVLWGSQIQQGYSDVVSQGLQLSRSEVLVKTSRYIERMMEILGSIRLEKVLCKKSDSFLAKALGRVSKEIDTLMELEEAEREIEQLVSLVNASIHPLLDLKTKAEKLSVEVERVRVEADASSIAALCICKYFSLNSRTDLSQIFTDRSMSLTATCAQIKSGSSIRQIQIEQPLRLINIAQNVVLVTLPGLIANISALQTMAKGTNKPTVTQIGELGDQIQKTLQSLKV